MSSCASAVPRSVPKPIASGGAWARGARRRGRGLDVRTARWRHRGGYISEYRHRPSALVTEPPPRTQQSPPRAPSLPDAPSPLPAFSRRRLPQAVSTEEKESYRMSAIQNLHSFGKLRKGPTGGTAEVGWRGDLGPETGPRKLPSVPALRKFGQSEGVRPCGQWGQDLGPGVGL